MHLLFGQLFPVILWRVGCFLQIPIFEVQSEFDPTAVRAQIEACWKRQLQWLLEDSGYNIRCLVHDARCWVLEISRERIQLGFLSTDDVYRTSWKFKEARFVQHVDLYIHIYHQALLAEKKTSHSPKHIPMDSNCQLKNESPFTIYSYWCHR